MNRVQESGKASDMKTNLNMYNMSDRELKNYRRAIKLRRERRKKCFTLAGAALAAICMIIVCTVSYSAIKTKANSGFKYYTSVTVGAGETLWELADNYVDYNNYKDKNSYIAEVKSINHLDEEGTVTAGQMLIFPYYSLEFVY